MSLSEFHDGEAVKAALKSTGMTARELGQALANTNIYSWLKKKHWPTDMLYKAGEVLGEDFFEEYRRNGMVPPLNPLIGFLIPPEAMQGGLEKWAEWISNAQKEFLNCNEFNGSGKTTKEKHRK